MKASSASSWNHQRHRQPPAIVRMAASLSNSHGDADRTSKNEPHSAISRLGRKELDLDLDADAEQSIPLHQHLSPGRLLFLLCV